MSSKPDILVFLSDQHHAQYAGFAGHSLVRTPHLDQLAKEGTVMSTAYTSSPLCVPSRTSMLTGQLPEKTGVFTNEGAIGSDQATFCTVLPQKDTTLCCAGACIFSERISGMDSHEELWGS